jgi:aminopeptidase N
MRGINYARLICLFVLGTTNHVVFGQKSSTEKTKTIAQQEQAGRQGILQRVAVSDGRAQNIDIKRHILRLHADPAVLYIKGAVSTRFTWKTADRSHLYFDLVSSLSVDSILYHGQRLTGDRTEANVLKITLPTSSTHAYDSITVYYKGTPPSSGFGSIVQYNHGGSPILWTLSEPYGAKDWWPCKQDLVDKIDSVDMYMECPVGNKVGSNGLLRSVRPTTAGWQIYHWQERYPITCYLISFAITNYEEYTYKFKLGADSLLYQNYLYPESNNQTTKDEIDQLPQVLRVYDSLFGGYPFKREKYGHAQFSWGGGQEHQTMSSMIGFDISLSSHELAHQWFGDKVTCGSWQDIWLNEGFATYLEGISRLYTGRLADWQTWKSQTLTYITSQPNGSVFVDDTTNEARIFDGRLSYNKGAFVLHGMRGLLGDSAFYAGVRNYLADPTLAYYFGRTRDLKRHLEAASGKNLTEYLNDYYYGQGYPMYAIQYVQPTPTGPLNVYISQTTTDASVPFFENRVPIRINYVGGLKDTVYLSNSVNRQTFSIPTTGQVQSIEYDPEKWVLGTGRVQRVTALASKDNLGKVTLMPNPAKDKVVIEGLPLQNHEAELTVLDTNGKTLRTSTTQNGTFSVQGLPAGAYIIHIEQGNFEQKLRLLIER